MSEAPVNPSPESQSLWYYADASNEPVGPLPMDVLQRLAGVGVILPETHVLEKGSTEWVKFASIVPPPARAETNPAPPDIALSSAAVPAKENAADGIKQHGKQAEEFFNKCGLRLKAFAVFAAGKCQRYWKKAEEFFADYKRGLKAQADKLAEKNPVPTGTGISSAAVAADTTPSSAAPPAKEKRSSEIGAGCGCLIILVVVVRFAYSIITHEPSSQDTGKPGGKTSEELATSDRIITDIQSAPLEYGLVFLDSGHFPRGNDINAARIRFLLKTISEKTGDSRETIADTASRATAVIKANYGRIVTTQKFLEQAYQYFETGAPRESITAVAPVLTMLMGR